MCSSIDLDPVTVDSEAVLTRDARRLVAELTSPRIAAEVAWRGRHRWESGVQSLPLEPVDEDELKSVLKQNGVYMITGAVRSCRV